MRYSRFNELHADIQLCQEMSKIAGEAQCMALEGMTGTGKSTLVKTYTATFARDGTGNTTKIPVFYMETPSPVTVKGMAARMLETMGDPAAHKGPLWSMNSRLIRYIKLCRVQLVVLDDETFSRPLGWDLVSGHGALPFQFTQVYSIILRKCLTKVCTSRKFTLVSSCFGPNQIHVIITSRLIGK